MTVSTATPSERGVTVSAAYTVPAYVDCNADRAATVRPLVDLWARTAFGHSSAFAAAEVEGIDVLLGDLVANLLHLADELRAAYPYDPSTGTAYDDPRSFLAAGVFHYEAECDEEDDRP